MENATEETPKDYVIATGESHRKEFQRFALKQ